MTEKHSDWHDPLKVRCIALQLIQLFPSWMTYMKRQSIQREKKKTYTNVNNISTCCIPTTKVSITRFFRSQANETLIGELADMAVVRKKKPLQLVHTTATGGTTRQPNRRHTHTTKHCRGNHSDFSSSISSKDAQLSIMAAAHASRWGKQW